MNAFKTDADANVIAAYSGFSKEAVISWLESGAAKIMLISSAVVTNNELIRIGLIKKPH